MLDTNIVSELIRHPKGVCAQAVIHVSESNVITSIIVAAELRYGAIKRASPVLSQRVDQVLAAMMVLPFGPPADRIYGELRTELEREGRLIGANDLLIAAHAIASRATIVTTNEVEFRRVPGLTVENWLRSG